MRPRGLEPPRPLQARTARCRPQERGRVLLCRKAEILNDFEVCVYRDSPTVAATLRAQTLAAINAHHAGHWRPAQADGAAILTTALEGTSRFPIAH